MTAKQADVWSMYASGYTVTQIALALGRSKGAVSGTIKTLKRRMTEKKQAPVSVPCVYSPSCFTCPLRDCVVHDANVNAIWVDDF